MACQVIVSTVGEEAVAAKLYKPTSKLLEKKLAETPKLLKPKDEEKPERPVCGIILFTHFVTYVFLPEMCTRPDP
jgi:hypothetical protein